MQLPPLLLGTLRKPLLLCPGACSSRRWPESRNTFKAHKRWGRGLQEPLQSLLQSLCWHEAFLLPSQEQGLIPKGGSCSVWPSGHRASSGQSVAITLWKCCERRVGITIVASLTAGQLQRATWRATPTGGRLRLHQLCLLRWAEERRPGQ